MGRFGVGGWGDDFVADSGLRTGVGKSVTCSHFHAIIDLEYTADMGRSCELFVYA